MMIDAVMYGMIPSAKSANWVSAPPENSWRKPTHAAAGLGLALELLDGVEVDAGRGDERADPVEGDDQQGEEDLPPQIGDPEHVPDAGQHGLGSWSAALPAAADDLDQRLANWLPWTGGRRSPHGLGRTSTVPPAAVMAASADLEKAWAFTVTLRVSSPRPSTLMRAPLWARPLAWSVAGLISSRPLSSMVSRLMPWYSTRNGLLKPLSFGMPHVQRHLPALEAGGDVAAGLLALGAAAGGLAALAGDAPADALLAPVGARDGLQVVDLDGFAHELLLLDRDEVRHAGQHPSDLGTIRKGVRLADAAEAERPQRAPLLGLGADGRPDLGDGDRAFGHHATSSGTWACGPRSLSR